MKIKEIINHLESKGEWVNKYKTRDHILYGCDDTEISTIIVCWVATLDIIEQAIKNKCHFIITHENPFYIAGTSIHNEILKSQEQKYMLLKKHNITIYRCHDLWDLYPEIGVRDMWAKTLQIPFEKIQNPKSFLRISKPFKMTVHELSTQIIQNIEPYHQNGIEIIGDINKVVHRLGIGTGACTDPMDMVLQGADVCLVSDDAINNWTQVQWAMDRHIPLIIVNHMTSEAPGIKSLSDYLSHQFPQIQCLFIANNYGIHHISNKKIKVENH